jgi:hypothetical protein
MIGISLRLWGQQPPARSKRVVSTKFFRGKKRRKVWDYSKNGIWHPNYASENNPVT